MSDHIIVFEPDEDVINKLFEYGNLVSTWDNGEKELLFELDNNLYSERELNSWLREKSQDDFNMVISKISSKSEIYEWLDSDKEYENRLNIDDFIPEHSEMCEIINEESPGGDIRKYMNTIYGGQKFSINFSLFNSQDITITGMEPMSMFTVQKLFDKEFVDTSAYKGEKLYYPPAKRILEWSNIVEERWNLECGARGSFHNPYGTDTVELGFNGFVIYDADEEVKQWCNERWNSEEIAYPFMCPDEYDLLLESEKSIPRSAIRMWWD